MTFEMHLFALVPVVLICFAIGYLRGCKGSFERGRQAGYDEGVDAGREECIGIEKRLGNWYD